MNPSSPALSHPVSLRLRQMIVCSAAAIGAVFFSSPMHGAINSTLTVDCGTTYGGFPDMQSRINISFFPDSQAWLAAADGDFLIANQFATNAVRIFLNPGTVQKNGIGNYDNYVNEVKRVTSAILVTMGPSPDMPPATYRTLMRQILEHYKALAPNIVYIEAMNEYDLSGISDTEYYNTYYKMFYQEINSFNATLPAGVPKLKVGGPTTGFDRVGTFIRNYAADTDPNKKLDFICFHEYQVPRVDTVHQNDAYHLPMLGTRRDEIESMLASNGLPTTIPCYVTEHGIFPGSTFSRAGFTLDNVTNLMQAASAATLNYYYVTTGRGRMYPFVWNSRTSSQQKAMYANATNLSEVGVLTPFGNTIKMFSLLTQPRAKVTATAVDPSNGFGVYALPTADTDIVSVMVWNWQFTAGNSSNVTLSFNNLPAAFAGRYVKMTRVLIDSTHSNNLSPSGNADLQVVASSNAFSTTGYQFSLEPNALTQIILTPGAPLPTGVTFYRDNNYGGAASQLLAKGNYTMAQLAAKGVPNDWASSVKIPAGWTVIIYSNDNFGGTSWTRAANTASFGSLSPSANDLMSSCKIQ
jgi:hypothetical protein